jgi:hypothetical protein
MKYALLIYETTEAFAGRGEDPEASEYVAAWRSYHQSLVASGSYLGGDPLRAPETGSTVRVQDGRRRIQDGPYAETKEQLGGFILVELPNLDAALEWASRCPAARYGAVEVRPIATETRNNITQEGDPS